MKRLLTCRVAEGCFWLHRYMERIDYTSRMLHVNLDFVLDSPLDSLRSWRPLLIVLGEEPAFLEAFGEDAVADGERAQQHLVWNPANPFSILNSAYWARENARTIRDSVSREVWECVNGFWLWLDGGAARRVFRREPQAFYTRLEETAQLFRGTSADTMLHEQPMDFMRLGLHLERAGQTARILDIAHHALGRETPAPENTAERFAQLSAILRICGATESFFKRARSLQGDEVAEFLIRDVSFPRSVLHCLARAESCLARIRAVATDGVAGSRVGSGVSSGLGALVASLTPRGAEPLATAGLHEELTRIIDTTADICDAVQRDFFEPVVPGEGTTQAQTQSQGHVRA